MPCGRVGTLARTGHLALAPGELIDEPLGTGCQLVRRQAAEVVEPYRPLL